MLSHTFLAHGHDQFTSGALIFREQGGYYNSGTRPELISFGGTANWGPGDYYYNYFLPRFYFRCPILGTDFLLEYWNLLLLGNCCSFQLQRFLFLVGIWTYSLLFGNGSSFFLFWVILDYLGYCSLFFYI